MRSDELAEEGQKNGAEERRETHSGPAKPTCKGHTKECEKALEQERKTKEAGTAFFERRSRVHATGSSNLSTDRCAHNRYRLLAKAVQERPTIAEQVLIEHSVPGNRSCTQFKSEQLLAEYSRNWPSDELLRDVGGLVVGVVLWLANFLYGGIHAAAWNDHFPSAVEKWLWRASASYIGFCGGLWVVLNFVVSNYQPLNDFWEHWMDGQKGRIHNLSLGSLVFTCGFSLMLARAYIVVEAFVSIRELPSAAYETPTWSQIFPHF